MIWYTLAITIVRSIILAIWFFFKPILGWFFIVIGLIGMPMPIVNGLIFLMIGLALVGPRNRVVRWWRVHIKLFLQRWAHLSTPLIGPLGRLANRSAQNVSRASRRLHRWFRDRRTVRNTGSDAVTAADRGSDISDEAPPPLPLPTVALERRSRPLREAESVQRSPLIITKPLISGNAQAPGEPKRHASDESLNLTMGQARKRPITQSHNHPIP